MNKGWMKKIHMKTLTIKRLDEGDDEEDTNEQGMDEEDAYEDKHSINAVFSSSVGTELTLPYMYNDNL